MFKREHQNKVEPDIDPRTCCKLTWDKTPVD